MLLYFFSPPSPSFASVMVFSVSVYLSCVNLLFPHTHVSHHCWPSCRPSPCVIVPKFCFNVITCVWRVNGCNSPNEIPSLDTPPGESPSPSPTQPLEPQIQNQKENQAKKEEGDQTAFIPCIEIHATGARRSSEPLPYNLPQPHAELPLGIVTHLIVTSEQRSLSWYVFSKPQISYPISFLLAMVLIHSSSKSNPKSTDSRFFDKIWKYLFTLF